MSQPERLLRAFLDFAAAVQHLKSYISSDGNRRSGDDIGSLLGPLALETLCLWCRRAPAAVKKTSSGYDEFLSELATGGSATQEADEPSDVIGPAETVAIKAADAMTAVLMTEPFGCSPKLLSAGAVPALVHALKTSSGLLQASACCCLQNLSAVDEKAREGIADEGGVKALVELARDAKYPPAAAAACGTLQNISLLSMYESSIVEAGGIRILVQCCKDQGRSSDPYVIESAAMALKNLAAGSDTTRVEISRFQGIQILSDLLKITKVPHSKNGVIELRMPSKSLIIAAAGSLRGLSMVADLQQGLWAAGLLPNISALIERLLMDGSCTSSKMHAELAEGLENMMGILRNIALFDLMGKGRAIMFQSQLGAVVSRLLGRLVLNKATGALLRDDSAQLGDERGEGKDTGGTVSPDRRRKSSTAASKAEGILANARVAELLEESVAALRNMLAGQLDLQEQAGSAGCVETLCILVNISATKERVPPDTAPPDSNRQLAQDVHERRDRDGPELTLEGTVWHSERLLHDALLALANVTQLSEANRQRALSAGCLRQTMVLASGGSSWRGQRRVAGAAALVLHSLSQLPAARARIVERDGIKLLFRIASSQQVSEEELVGSIGSLCNLCRTTQQLTSLASFGAIKLLSRLCADCPPDVVLFEIVSLLAALIEVDALRVQAMEDGAIRAILRLFESNDRESPHQNHVGDESGIIPTTASQLSKSEIRLRDGKGPTPLARVIAQPVLEVAAGAICTCAQDPYVRPYLVKIGAPELLSTRSGVARRDSDKVRRLTRLALNRLM